MRWLLFSRAGLRLALIDETPRIQKEIPFVMFDVWNLFFVVFIYLAGKSLMAIAPISFSVSTDPETSFAHLYENNAPHPAL